MILAIFYWIGYAIVFLTLFVFSAYAFANKERLERENPDRDISLFNMLFALLVLPWFSWFLIAFFGLALVFELYKEKQNEI